MGRAADCQDVNLGVNYGHVEMLSQQLGVRGQRPGEKFGNCNI